MRLTDVVPMEAHHQDKAWVPALPGRMAYILKDWRWFSYRWSFASRRVSGAFQGIFTVEVPKDVSIVSYMPEWLANAHLTLNGKDYRYTPSGLVDIDARRPSSSLD
ncbi:MAG TPA: hypothetical protein VMU29_14910 [Smithella sp.]|nr:hypothetical protein [Smithella sp.]